MVDHVIAYIVGAVLGIALIAGGVTYAIKTQKQADEVNDSVANAAKAQLSYETETK